MEREGRVVVGDRVAAFHPMGERGGAYAEFAVAPVGTVFRLPGGMRFEGMWFSHMNVGWSGVWIGAFK